MKTSLFVVSGAALALTAAASADLVTVVDLDGPYTFGPGGFVLVDVGPLFGELTGVNITFDFSGAQAGSWVADFVLGVDDIGWGGFNVDFGLDIQSGWDGFPNGGAPGTYTGKAFVSGAPIAYNGETATLLLGNGWTSGGFTIENISITLKGVKIPAPGAFALLGLAGLAGTRRRRA